MHVFLFESFEQYIKKLEFVLTFAHQYQLKVNNRLMN